jgi:hypothetical protein
MIESTLGSSGCSDDVRCFVCPLVACDVAAFDDKSLSRNVKTASSLSVFAVSSSASPQSMDCYDLLGPSRAWLQFSEHAAFCALLFDGTERFKSHNTCLSCKSVSNESSIINTRRTHQAPSNIFKRSCRRQYKPLHPRPFNPVKKSRYKPEYASPSQFRRSPGV